jgi:hypothetical protein
MENVDVEPERSDLHSFHQQGNALAAADTSAADTETRVSSFKHNYFLIRHRHHLWVWLETVSERSPR